MTSLLDQAELLEPVIAMGRSRAIAAGVDPCEYDAITASLGAVSEWSAAFRSAGAAHLAAARHAEETHRKVTAADAYLAAAACCHIATALATGLRPRMIGLMALSLGGYYGARALAREPRLAAGVTVSGPSTMTWDQLPELLRAILTIRAGSPDGAVAFTEHVDVRPFAAEITQPLMVLDGEHDNIPGYTDGRQLAHLAPRGEHHVIPAGDHLVGNRQWQWLPQAADFLPHQLECG